ncbi:hypothetical protein ACRXCV_00230 (plasmid) [Halobacteriovorax sp. GFR7]|uniref:hypothetical protein n=1 Tax=unclassified Halobacteriovorax TaxID=2639665 RepID=UPI003D985371
MKANQFYKGTAYKAGTPKNTEPTLRLEVLKTCEERKHINVQTKNGVKMLLAYDGKAGWFHLHKYSPLGNIGGHVYNNFDMNEEDTELLMAAAGRWSHD